MNTHILELVSLIKETDIYKTYIENNNRLNQEPTYSLLTEYHSKIEEYNNLKKYNQYIDNSKLKNEIKDLKEALSKDENIIEYYNAYYQLNELLDEVTNLVFKDIDSSLIHSHWNI